MDAGKTKTEIGIAQKVSALTFCRPGVDPDEITDILHCAPNEYQKEGESSDVGLWKLFAPSSIEGVDEQLKYWSVFVSQKQKEFGILSKRGYEAYIDLPVSSRDLSVCLEPETMKRFSEFDVAVSVWFSESVLRPAQSPNDFLEMFIRSLEPLPSSAENPEICGLLADLISPSSAPVTPVPAASRVMFSADTPDYSAVLNCLLPGVVNKNELLEDLTRKIEASEKDFLGAYSGIQAVDLKLAITAAYAISMAFPLPMIAGDPNTIAQLSLILVSALRRTSTLTTAEKWSKLQPG